MLGKYRVLSALCLVVFIIARFVWIATYQCVAVCVAVYRSGCCSVCCSVLDFEWVVACNIQTREVCEDDNVPVCCSVCCSVLQRVLQCVLQCVLQWVLQWVGF